MLVNQAITIHLGLPRRFLSFLTFCLLLVSGFQTSVFALSADLYPFATVQKEQKFQKLTEQLRCLVCQNESLADSTATLAQDLRTQIYQKVKQGETSHEIVQYLVARYGDFVTFRPPVNKLTYVLWYGPYVLLLLVVLGIFMVLYRRHLSYQRYERGGLK